jgi:hypothetical protein
MNNFTTFKKLILFLFNIMTILAFALLFPHAYFSTLVFFRFASTRAFPSAVRGPVDNPP